MMNRSHWDLSKANRNPCIVCGTHTIMVNGEVDGKGNQRWGTAIDDTYIGADEH